MKSIILVIVIFFTAFTLKAAPEKTQTVGVIVSPHQSEESKTNLLKLLEIVVGQLTSGSTLVVYDAEAMRVITKGVLPKMVRETRELRAKLLQAQLADIKRWVASSLKTSTSLTNTTLQIPEVMARLTELSLPRPASVVLYGTPLCVYKNEPSFSMTELRYPAPGHLRLTPLESPYGVAGRSNALAGVSLHIVYPGESVWNSDVHRQAVRRFWAQWTKAQSGTLATFSADIQGKAEAFFATASEPVTDPSVDPNDTKAEMRFAEPRTIAPAMKHSTAKTNHIVPFPMDVKPGATAIGIRWSEPIDLDLHVKAHPSAAALNFKNTVTPEGRYVHDFRSRNDGSDYEWVELNPPIDLGVVEVFINYFEGTVSPVTVRLCVIHEGREYYGDVRLTGPAGDQAADSRTRELSRAWIKVDLQRLLSRVP